MSTRHAAIDREHRDTRRTATGWTRAGLAAFAVATVQYFVVQLVVAAAWHDPPYDWAANLISDLGNTTCGPFTQGGSTTLVCSPLHTLMNVSFVASGVLTAVGALALAARWPATRLTRTGTVLLLIAAAQKAMVGLFPENTVAALHQVGALNLVAVLVAIVAFSLGVLRHHRPTGVCGLAVAVISVASSAALLLAGNGTPAGPGPGALERVLAYPSNTWPLIVCVLALTAGRHATRAVAVTAGS